jgi:hypothetical protein
MSRKFRLIALLLIAWMSTQSKPAGSAAAPSTTVASGPLIAQWKTVPELDGNAVKGSVIVANQGDDDFDETVVIEAINEIGKAFTIGYQHFPLQHRSISPLISFQMTLPPGRYVILADAIAEIAAKKKIHRARLSAMSPLVITTI